MTKFANKSFSVPCPTDVSQERWDKIFKKDTESRRGVLRKCDDCDRTKYTWKVGEDWICASCQEARGITLPKNYD